MATTLRRPTPDALLDALPGLADGRILVNSWLADQLSLRPGDAVTVRYSAFAEAHRIEPRTTSLTVERIVPLAGAASDRGWMPDVPHLTDVPSCRDWHPGLPIDTGRIRPVDEDYFREHGATPKAFLTLGDGERLFGGVYGTRTALRWPSEAQGSDAARADHPVGNADAPPSNDAALLAAARLADGIARAVNPAALGLAFVAPSPATAAVDFGPLFLGFGVVLLVAALLLSSLFVSLSIEQRAAEWGALRALGFRGRDVLYFATAESVALAAFGALLAVPLGVAFTAAVLAALSSIWRAALGLPSLALAIRPSTMAVGLALAFVSSAFGVLWPTRRALAASSASLLASSAGAVGLGAPDSRGRPRSLWIAAVTFPGALVLVLVARGVGKGPIGAALWFGAGTLLLIGGCAGFAAILATLDRRARRGDARDLVGTRFGLALRSASLRPGRALTAVTLLAVGAFLVVGVGANRSDARSGAANPASGTGGYALYAESASPIARDLTTADGRAALGLDGLPPRAVLPLLLHDGDEASCRGPARPSAPRVLGVPSATLAARRAFTFTASLPTSGGPPFGLLEAPITDGAVPAIGDEGTVVWSLHRGLGDVVEVPGPSGRPVRLRIVGITATNLLQGALLVDAARFRAAFPDDGGFRVLLVDTPEPERTAALLEGALSDRGLVVTRAFLRLASFESVEDTYLAIFEALGTLGLLLGAAGLGLLVARAGIERRRELALLRAIGFQRGSIYTLLIVEHALLGAAGLVIGGLAALVSLVPAYGSSGFGPGRIAASLALVLASACLGVLVAAAGVLRVVRDTRPSDE